MLLCPASGPGGSQAGSPVMWCLDAITIAITNRYYQYYIVWFVYIYIYITKTKKRAIAIAIINSY